MFIHCNLCGLLGEKKNTFLFCLFFFVLPEILLHGNETDVREPIIRHQTLASSRGSFAALRLWLFIRNATEAAFIQPAEKKTGDGQLRPLQTCRGGDGYAAETGLGGDQCQCEGTFSICESASGGKELFGV